MNRWYEPDIIAALIAFALCCLWLGRNVADALSPWKDDRLSVKRYHKENNS